MSEDVNESLAVSRLLTASGLGIDLTEKELNQIASLAESMEFKKGARILEEGSLSRDIYFIHEGQVSVMLDLKAVQKFEERVARMDPHEVFGEFAFVSGDARTASILAETKVTLFRLKHEDLTALFAKEPMIGYKIMRNIAVTVTKRVAEQHKMVRKLLFCS